MLPIEPYWRVSRDPKCRIPEKFGVPGQCFCLEYAYVGRDPYSRFASAVPHGFIVATVTKLPRLARHSPLNTYTALFATEAPTGLRFASENHIARQYFNSSDVDKTD